MGSGPSLDTLVNFRAVTYTSLVRRPRRSMGVTLHQATLRYYGRLDTGGKGADRSTSSTDTSFLGNAGSKVAEALALALRTVGSNTSTRSDGTLGIHGDGLALDLSTTAAADQTTGRLQSISASSGTSAVLGDSELLEGGESAVTSGRSVDGEDHSVAAVSTLTLGTVHPDGFGGRDLHVPGNARLAFRIGLETRVHATLEPDTGLIKGRLSGRVVQLQEDEADSVAHGGFDALRLVLELGKRGGTNLGRRTTDGNGVDIALSSDLDSLLGVRQRGAEEGSENRCGMHYVGGGNPESCERDFWSCSGTALRSCSGIANRKIELARGRGPARVKEVKEQKTKSNPDGTLLRQN